MQFFLISRQFPTAHTFPLELVLPAFLPHLLHFSMHSTCLCTVPCPSLGTHAVPSACSTLAHLHCYQTLTPCGRFSSRGFPQWRVLCSSFRSTRHTGTLTLPVLTGASAFIFCRKLLEGRGQALLNCGPWSLAGSECQLLAAQPDE